MSDRPATVGYRIADSPKLLKQAHALIKAEGLSKQELEFPTVVALEDKVIGLIGTKITNNMIVAGPLVIKSDRRRIMTAIRMVEMYEIAMKGLGISSFIFSVEDGSLLEKLIERYGYEPPYAEEEGRKFYVRRL